MTLAILESPYAGNVKRNVEYAKFCVKDMLKKGEAPIASHLLFTQEGILDDTSPEERKLGINAGHAWLSATEKVVFYLDFGMSNGMKMMMDKVTRLNAELSGSEEPVVIETRHLPPELVKELEEIFPD